MARDTIRQKVSKNISRSGRVLRACRCMIDARGNIITMSVRFRAEIPLPFRSKLSQVMPQTRKVSPSMGRRRFLTSLWKHLFCKFPCPPRHLIQVAVIGSETFASITWLAGKRAAFGCEKRFPF